MTSNNELGMTSGAGQHRRGELQHVFLAAFLAFLVAGCEAPTPPPSPPPEEPRGEEPAPPPEPTPDPEPELPRGVTALPTDGAPSPRSEHLALAASPASFVVLGGHDLDRDFADGGILDLEAMKWRPVAFPTGIQPRFKAAGAIGEVAGKQVAYIFGGSRYRSVTRSRGDRLGDGGALEVATGQWLRTFTQAGTANIPSPRAGHCAVADGFGRLVVWGGENQGTHLADGGIYDPASDQWRPIPKSTALYPGPAAREGHYCRYDEERGTMLLYGGLGPSGVLADLWELTPTLPPTWREIPLQGDVEEGRYSPCIGYSKGRLLVYGGSNPAALRDGFIVDVDSGTRRTLVPAPSGGTPIGDCVLDDLAMVGDGSDGLVLVGAVQTGNRTLFRGHRLLLPVGLEADGQVVESLPLTGEGQSALIGMSGATPSPGSIVLWGGRDEAGRTTSRGLLLRIER